MSGRLLGALLRRLPSALLLLALGVVGLARLVLFALGRWWLSWPLVFGGLGWWLVGRYGGAPVAAWALLIVAGLGFAVAAWSWLGPDSFETRLAGPVRSWRRRRHYAPRWDEAVDGAGLVRAGVAPVLMAVRAGPAVDELSVHMAPGSLVTEWRDAAPRLASALEVRSVRVRHDGPRDVLLLVRRWVRAIDPGGDPVLVAGPEIPADELAGAEPEPEPEPSRPAFPRRPS